MKSTQVYLNTPIPNEHLVVFTQDEGIVPQVVNYLVREVVSSDIDALAAQAYKAQFNKETVDVTLNVYHPEVATSPVA